MVQFVAMEEDDCVGASAAVNDEGLRDRDVIAIEMANLDGDSSPRRRRSIGGGSPARVEHLRVGAIASASASASDGVGKKKKITVVDDDDFADEEDEQPDDDDEELNLEELQARVAEIDDTGDDLHEELQNEDLEKLVEPGCIKVECVGYCEKYDKEEVDGKLKKTTYFQNGPFKINTTSDTLTFGKFTGILVGVLDGKTVRPRQEQLSSRNASRLKAFNCYSKG